MPSFVGRICPNTECQSHIKPYPSDRPREALCKIMGGDSSSYDLQCETCGVNFESGRPSERHNRMRWPRYCASTDKVFESRDTERAYVKKNGLEAL